MLELGKPLFSNFPQGFAVELALLICRYSRKSRTKRDARILAFSDKPPRHVTPITCGPQSDLDIGSESDPLLFAVEPILEAPPFVA